MGLVKPGCSFNQGWEVGLADANYYILLFSHSTVSSSVTPWPACQASLSFTISQSSFKLKSRESVMPSNHLIFGCPLLPSNFPSIMVSSNELALGIRWLKYWSFSFSISPSIEYSGLISFRSDWFDRSLKRFSQHHRKHQFFSIQPSLWSNSHIRT